MKKRKVTEITIERLFKEFEALRVLMRVSISDAAFMIEVTPLTYKNWKNKSYIPRGHREPLFRSAITRLKKRYEELDQQS